MIKVLGIALIFGTFVLASSSTLTGDHICHRQENYTETVNATTSEPIQVRKNFWCLEKIRCSELQPELKEVVQVENVTKSRTIDFCCPEYEESELDGKKFCKPICAEKCKNGNCTSPGKCECDVGYTGDMCDKQCPSNRFGKMCSKYCKCGDLNCHPQTGECLKAGDKIELSTTTTMKPIENGTTVIVDPFMKSLNGTSTAKVPATEHNPYENYTREYGREFNHYVAMSVNESDVQRSIDKIVEVEIKRAKEELGQEVVEDIDGYILLDVSGNEIRELESLKHPQFVSDHHAVSQHEESIAMVTVGCLILAMLVFLLAMVYIRRITRRVPASRDIDLEADFQKPQAPHKLEPSKIVHEPLPIPPLRPSLRKAKSVTFDESIDEVDDKNRKRARSLGDTYDVPRRQSSMMDLCAESVKITPQDVAAYAFSQKNVFNTFPRKNISRKQSMEHIYDEIPIPHEIAGVKRMKIETIEDLTDAVYQNQETVEKTKM